MALVLVVGSACSESRVWGSLLVLSAADGSDLAGTYLRPPGPERAPVFILLHQPGTARSRSDFNSIWYPLSEQGVGLLAPDLRGHGESEGSTDYAELSHDPAGYPPDLDHWLSFLANRSDDGDRLDLDRIAIIGLSSSASLAAAALGRGRAQCAVAVSAQLSEVNALAAGFAMGDDDDSAGDGDDDDSAAFEGDGVDPSLPLSNIRWLYSSEDEASATDSAVLSAATAGESDLVEFAGDAHGVELLWESDAANESVIAWCLSRL
jgi:pimeloyl-ACP methyl ester carboxylesterase